MLSQFSIAGSLLLCSPATLISSDVEPLYVLTIARHFQRYAIHRIPKSLSCRHLVMFKKESKPTETLADYVRRIRNEKGLSLRDVQERSGNLTTVEYVSKIESGWVLHVTPTKLSGVAKGLDVSEREIFTAAKENGQGQQRGNLHLNKKQRVVIFLGVIILALMLFVPPWKYYRGGQAGYRILFVPSIRLDMKLDTEAPRSIEDGGIFLDTTRLFVQCLLIALITGGAVLVLKGRYPLTPNKRPMDKPSIFDFR